MIRRLVQALEFLEAVDVPVKTSDDVLLIRKMAGNAPMDQDVFLLDDPQSFPVSREMGDFHGLASTSVILLVLRASGDTLGYHWIDDDHFKYESYMKMADQEYQQMEMLYERQ